MHPSLKLLRSCSIQEGQVWVDGHEVFAAPGTDFAAFASAAYKYLQVDYPKFHKMDNLSKLGFLAAEYLLTSADALTFPRAEQVGLVVANAHSSTDTDLRYNAQVQQEVASPALFVYTLPNIVLGEICIRHGFKGENMLFVSKEYDVRAQVNYATTLLESQVIDQCLGGWVDYFNQQYRAFFYIAARSAKPHLPDYTTATVETLFTT